MKKIIFFNLVFIISIFGQKSYEKYFEVNSDFFDNRNIFTTSDIKQNETFFIIYPKEGVSMYDITIEFSFPSHITYYIEKNKLGSKTDGGILPWQNIEIKQYNKLVFNKEFVYKVRPFLTRFYLLPQGTGEGVINVFVKFKDEEEKLHEYQFKSGEIISNITPQISEIISLFPKIIDETKFELNTKVKYEYILDNGYKYEHESVLDNSIYSYNFEIKELENQEYSSPFLGYEKSNKVNKYTFSTGTIQNNNQILDINGKSFNLKGQLNKTIIDTVIPSKFEQKFDHWKWDVFASLNFKLLPSSIIKIPSLTSYYNSINFNLNLFNYRVNKDFGFNLVQMDMYSNFNKDFGFTYSPGIYFEDVNIFGIQTAFALNIGLGLHSSSKNQISNKGKDPRTGLLSTTVLSSRITLYKGLYMSMRLVYVNGTGPNSTAKNDPAYNGLFLGLGYKF